MIELAATAVIGGIGLAVAGENVGVFTWAVGILLSLNQVRLEVATSRHFSRLSKLAQVIDIREECDVETLREVVTAYLGVREEEFRSVKDGIVTSARDELLRLANEKSSGELPPAEYYRWLLPKLESASAPTTVRALSLMMSCEWDGSPSEKRFLQASVQAAERGVKTDRIFVMRRATLPSALANPAVKKHLRGERPRNLRGHFVDLDWLEQHDPRLRGRLGDGFICFDNRNRVALIDRHSRDGSARGEVTMLTKRLDELERLHNELLVHSEELSLELLGKVDLEAEHLNHSRGSRNSR